MLDLDVSPGFEQELTYFSNFLLDAGRYDLIQMILLDLDWSRGVWLFGVQEYS